MSTSRIAELIARILVHPSPLFHNDDNAVAIEETLATQGPTDSGEVNRLPLSSGLMDFSMYVDMLEPWVEGLRSEKVSSLLLVMVDPHWCFQYNRLQMVYVMAYINNLVAEVGQGLRFNVGEVRAEIWVKWG
jgi:hypothetical protein